MSIRTKTRGLRVRCPKCHRATVAVGVSAWKEEGQAHKSVWLDEPASCAGGCRLTEEDVRRLLVSMFRQGSAQLRLSLEEVPV